MEVGVSILKSLLQSRLLVTKAARQAYGGGPGADDEVVNTNRCILVLKGCLEYEVEGSVTHVRKHTLIYVPAWVRREWHVSKARTCEILWCEFSAQLEEQGQDTLFYNSKIDMDLEERCLTRIADLWNKFSRQQPRQTSGRGISPVADPFLPLEMEGELKAMLARFWPGALPWHRQQATQPAGRMEVKEVIAWLEAHYREPDALEKLKQTHKLAADYFRSIFKTQTGITPTHYLKMIRMRRARYLLSESKLTVKEIATAVGYEDPLYFSRQYRAFWGHPPTTDRNR